MMVSIDGSCCSGSVGTAVAAAAAEMGMGDSGRVGVPSLEWALLESGDELRIVGAGEDAEASAECEGKGKGGGKGEDKGRDRDNPPERRRFTVP